MNKWRALATMGALFVLATGTGPFAGASPRGASEYPIVYTSVRGGNAAIYLLKGAKSVKVGGAVDSPGHDCGPALRSRDRGDADELVFDSNRVTDPYSPNNFEIYRMNLRTERLLRLTNHPGLDTAPAWSPNGRKIAFMRDESPNVELVPGHLFSIWVMNADGSSQRQLTHGALEQGHFDPTWSPDGKRIAFTVYDTNPAVAPAIHLMNADGTHARMLTNDGEYATWSPDGKWIAFDSGRDQPQFESDLFVMNADGSNQRSIGHQDGAEMMASWSRDGTHIAYVHADFWTGMVLANVLPTGQGQDVYATAPTHVWQLELDRSGQGIARRQLSHGDTDLFPHFSPVKHSG